MVDDAFGGRAQEGCRVMFARSLNQHSDQNQDQPDDHRVAEYPNNDGPLHHRSEFGTRHIPDFGRFGHFGFGTVVSDAAAGQVPELRYLDDGALVAQFERFTVFQASRPRTQIGVLALDEEHAAVEGSNYLGLPRRLVAVVRTPGFLESSQTA